MNRIEILSYYFSFIFPKDNLCLLYSSLIFHHIFSHTAIFLFEYFMIGCHIDDERIYYRVIFVVAEINLRLLKYLAR
jgi:hypothetical protein